MSEVFAVRAQRVFDGHRSMGPGAVLIRDGVIEDVGEHVMGEFCVVELDNDVTLLPGLIDAHVHLCLNEDLDVLASMDLDDGALLTRMRAAADKTLAAGVTTVRDLGDRSFLALEIGGPLTVLAAGPPLTTKGGHCWFWGGEVETVEDMLRAVEVRAEKGCAVVKVMTSGGNVTPGSSLFDTQFSAKQLRIIVDEAHRLGLSAAAHCHAPEAVRNAVAAGFDTLEHLSFATETGVEADYAVLQQLVDEQRGLSATFGNLPGATPPPAIAARLAQARVHWEWLAEHGARIIIGSDAGLAPGKPHGVLPHALRDLLPVMGGERSLATMTSASAEVLGLKGRKGVLAPGADADLLAVRGDPLSDPEALHDVVGVWVGGTRHR